jgi:cob(I)alamin adenosyltransferase
LGLCGGQTTHPRLGNLLNAIQQQLFTIGAVLADPKRCARDDQDPAWASDDAELKLGNSAVLDLESAIDELQSSLPPLRSFILPGGTLAASALQIARAVCRRAEGLLVALSRDQRIPSHYLVYLNRLSDLLFVMARAENYQAKQIEQIW